MEQQKEAIPEKFESLQQAGDYIHVERQAVYSAIRKGKLKAEKVNGRYVTTSEELDTYRKNKYNRALRKIEGELVFDLDKGHLSIGHVATTLGVPTQHVYYLVRRGKLKAFKKGGSWVVLEEDFKVFREQKKRSNNKQMSFA